jgi:type VI protein secretion system component VasK
MNFRQEGTRIARARLESTIAGDTFMWRRLIICLALLSPPAASAGDTQQAALPAQRTIDEFLAGSDAERDAMLQHVVKLVAQRGYRQLSVVPWFVLAAKNAAGKDVVLLVDPVSLTATELEYQVPAGGKSKNSNSAK